LDHINGINNDHRLENLRWVCPNCNSQLSTFAGKNVKRLDKKKISEISIPEVKKTIKKEKIKKEKKTSKISKNVLEEQLKREKGNFTKIAKLYGITDNALRKWCSKNGLPTSSNEYKQEAIVLKKIKIGEVLDLLDRGLTLESTAKTINTTKNRLITYLKKNKINYEKYYVTPHRIKSISPDGEEKIHENIKKATEYLRERTKKESKNLETSIQKVCKGKLKTVYKYKFMYL